MIIWDGKVEHVPSIQMDLLILRSKKQRPSETTSSSHSKILQGHRHGGPKGYTNQSPKLPELVPQYDSSAPHLPKTPWLFNITYQNEFPPMNYSMFDSMYLKGFSPEGGGLWLQMQKLSFHHIAAKNNTPSINSQKHEALTWNPLLIKDRFLQGREHTCFPIEKGTYLYLIMWIICLLIVRTKSTSQ